MPLLQLRDVTKRYAGACDHAVAGVSFELQAGETCALLGPSGSGKSSLLNILGVLDSPTSGDVLLRGRNLGHLTASESAKLRNREIGFVFQSFHLLPRLTAAANVALPLLYRGTSPRDQHIRALAALERVGLAEMADRRPDELSGGQRQRVAIARALVGEPSYLLADEPTGSLDSRTALQMLEIFEGLNAELGLTIIMVTHDRRLAARFARRIELLDGHIVQDTGA